ncbi:MAG TPA: EamA family transporter [Paracoccaceae bacterium]|nr:EamA family transporter [Paracoccaceae bacterium]
MRGGVGLIILAMSLTPALDGVAKELGREHAPIFVCFARYFSAGIVALAACQLLREPIRFSRQGLGGQILRSALMMGAMTAFITALSLVPLADAVGGFLIAPMVATALSVLFLGEALTIDKAIGGLLSLLGALLIMDPGFGMAPGALLALGGGVLLGCYFAASRHSSHGEGVISVLAVQSLMGSAMIAPIALADGVPEVGSAFFAWSLALGLLSALCHLLTILAFRLSEATVLAPFMYFNLIAAIAIGFLWFGEIPTPTTLLGLGAILLGGLVATLHPGQRALDARRLALAGGKQAAATAS